MRRTFGKVITELADKDEKIYVLVGDIGYRVFDESNCEELTPEGIQNGVGELRARAWSRENLMKLAPSATTLMQMLSPDWSDWGWRMKPEHREEARKVWGLAQ